MRCIPNLTIAARVMKPNSATSCTLLNCPAKVRCNPLSRGKGTIVDWHQPWKELTIGKGEFTSKDGNYLAVVTIGTMATLPKKPSISENERGCDNSTL